MSRASDLALAGFVKGVADYTGASIASQQEEERERRKAQLRAQLQEETEMRLAAFRDRLESQRADKDMSGADGEDYVIRDKSGNEKSRRKLTDDEKAGRDFQRQERDLSLRKGEADIRQGDERNALTRRGQDLEAAASRERNSIARLAAGNRSGSSAKDGVFGGTSSQIGYQLTDLNDDIVEQAAKAGVPREEIQRMASYIAAQQLAKGNRDPATMNDAFLRGVAELRKGIEGTGDDATWSISTFNSNRDRKTK